MAKKVTANGKTFTFDDNISNEQIGTVIDEYFSGIEKKNPVQNVSLTGSQAGSETLPIGSKPSQTQVDTKPAPYVKPKVKPKNISEAVEDDNNYLGAIYNNLIGAGSDFIGGFTRLVAKSNPYGSPVLAATADVLGSKAEQVVEKLRSGSSSKQYEEKIQQGFDLTKGVFTKENAKALPLMISRFAGDLGLAIPTAGASYLAQNYNQGLKEFDKAIGNRTTDDPASLNNARELFGVAYSTISSVADKYSLGFMTKSNPVAKKVKQAILKETVQELATKATGKITADVIEETASRIAKKGLNKFKSVGLKGLTSAGVEGGTEVITGVGTDLAKMATNLLTDKNIFNEEEVIEDFWKNRLNEFGGGAVLGGITGSAIRGIKSVDDMVAERVSSATNLNNVVAVAREIEQDLITRYNEGSLDVDRYDEIIKNLNKYVKATESIPFDIGAKKRKEAIQSIVDRDRVAEEIKVKQEQMSVSDESLVPQAQQELDILEAKKQSLNDNIVEATADEKFKYSKDPEKDLYYKQLGEDGELEEISKQQYELETQSVPKEKAQEIKTLAKPTFDTEEQLVEEIRAAEKEFNETGDSAEYQLKINDLNTRLENLVPAPEVEVAQPTQEAPKVDALKDVKSEAKPLEVSQQEKQAVQPKGKTVFIPNIQINAPLYDKPQHVEGASIWEGEANNDGTYNIYPSRNTENQALLLNDRKENIVPLFVEGNAYNQNANKLIVAKPAKIKVENGKVTQIVEKGEIYYNEIPKKVETPKTKQDAIQKQTAGQVPVLTEAPVGEEVEQGKPQPKAKVVAEEGKEEVGGDKGSSLAVVVDPINIELKNNKIEGKLFNEQEAKDYQELIESKYNTGSTELFGQEKQDIRQNMFSYDQPLAEKNVNGVNVRITEGLLEGEPYSGDRKKTYLLYADGKVAGKFYSVSDAKKVVNFIEANLVKSLPTQEQTPAQQVEQLRAEEQAELKAAIPNADQYLTDGKVDENKLTDPKDKKAFKKIYKKYNKLITPKLKEAKADAEVAELEKLFAGITTPSLENKGVSVTNKSAINEVKTKSKDTNKIKVVESAQKLLKTLQSVLPKFDIVIHDNEGSYNASMSEVNGLANSAGNFSYVKNQDGSYSGRIDINLDRANSRTVAHEVAHGIMLKSFGDNPPLFKNFRDKISKVLSETANKDLMDFANQYKGDVAYEEYLVELSAMLSEQGGKISPTSLQKIAAIINDIVSRLTKGTFKPFGDIKNTNDIIDFFNAISGAIREGSEIQQLNIKEPYSSGVALPVTNPNEFVGKKFKSKASIGDYKFPSGIDALKIADIPIKTLTELVRQYKGRVVIITSDATGYGVDKNGDPILGGFGFASNEKNVSDGIGFASVSTSTVKSTYTATEKAYGIGKSLVLIMIQPPHTTINNSYGAKYIIRGIKEIASSSKKDLIKTKEAIIDFIKGSKAIQQELKTNPASLKRGSEKRLLDLINSIDENINIEESVNEFLLDTTFTIRKELAKGIILENKNIRTNKSTNYSKIALNNVGYNIYDFLKEYGDNTILTDDLILNNTGGYVVGGFELNVLPNNQREALIDNIQNKGIVHPLFNAKLPGTNHFRLDSLYDVQENFSKYARPDTEISLAKEDRDNLVREIYKNDKFYNADARLIPLEERSYTNLTVPAKIEFKDKYLKQRGLLTESVPNVPTKVAKGEGFIPIENAAKEMAKGKFVSKAQLGTPDDIKQLISQARSKGFSDNAIETFLKSKGFDANEIKAQMGKPVVELKQDVKEAKGKAKRISFEDINDLIEIGATYIKESVKDLKNITFSEFSTRIQDEYGQDIPENIIRNIFKKSAAASKLGVRRTPERIGTGEAVSDSLKEVANETDALYQTQNYKEIQDRLDSMSEADKNTLVGTLANVTGQLNAEGNVGVLAAIDLINMYEANGDKAGAQRVFDTISKSATAFAQLLRQYGQLKSSTPQGYVSIVEKYMLDKHNIKLTDDQKQSIEKLYNDAKKAIDTEADALNNLVDDLTDVNYKFWGETTVLLEDANRRLADYIDSLKPATAQSLFQKLTSIVQGNLLSLKSLLLNPVANAAQAGIKLSGNEVANLLDFVLNVALKTGRTKISGFDPLAIRLGGKAFARGLSKANRMLLKGATATDLAKIDVAGRLKPVEAWKSLYKTLRGKQSLEFVKTIEDLAEGTIGLPANLALRLLPYGDLPRNEQVKIAKLIEIGRNKFGLKGKELEAFTLKPDPESLAEAELEGDKSTLQEPNKAYTFLNNIINSIDSKADDKFVKGILSGIKFMVRGTIVPFLKTPINYAAKAIRFTNPIIPYSQAVYNMVKAIQAAKNIKNPLLRESAIRKHQSKLTEYLGEAIIAQSIMSGALILIGNGLVTGDAPDDDKKEKDLMFQSLGPNMINISGLKRLLTGGDPTYKPGDTAIAYNALGILGAQLGISSNTLTTKEKENIREQKFVTTEGKPFYKEDSGFYLSSIAAMSSNLPASLNFTLNQGFAQGTGTLLASIQDNKYSEWSNQMVKTLVTGLNVPNTVYQSFKAGNDYYRNVYTEDQVKTWANIVQERYGNLEGLPINYDMWGKPIKLTPEGSNPYVYHLIDIFRTQKILQDKNTYYVFDLYKKTGDKSVIPSSVKDIIDEEGGVYTKLKADQKSELQRIVGEERAKYVNGVRGGSFSLKNYDPTNDNEKYLEKQVNKLKLANDLGLAKGKIRFEKEILNKTKK